MKKTIEAFFEESEKWKAEYSYLRKLMRDTGLDEGFKWGKPCYTYKGNNIVLIHGFKEYCALLFHKGVLLNDAEHILIQQTKNVQAGRQLRFSDLNEIKDLKEIIKRYVYEAIEIEKAGLEVKMKKTSEFEIPEELEQAFTENPDLKKAFKNLTPGRQRGYYLYFSEAKQSKTRKSRIGKYTPQIIKGKGLNDR